MESKVKRRIFWLSLAAAAVLLAILLPMLGTSSSPDGEPTPTWTNVPEIYFAHGIVEPGQDFTVKVNISEVELLWGAQFDVKYDYSVMTFVSASEGKVNRTPPDGLIAYKVGSGPEQEGLLRVLTKWNIYADAHGGAGVNGSGTICELTFHASPTFVTAHLGFVEGQGDPPGELKIMRAWEGRVYELQLLTEEEDSGP